MVRNSSRRAAGPVAVRRFDNIDCCRIQHNFYINKVLTDKRNVIFESLQQLDSLASCITRLATGGIDDSADHRRNFKTSFLLQGFQSEKVAISHVRYGTKIAITVSEYTG